MELGKEKKNSRGFFFVLLSWFPNHQRWHAKMEAQSEHAHVAHTLFFCTSGADLHAQSVLINKISSSELSRKFIKEVCCWLGCQNKNGLLSSTLSRSARGPKLLPLSLVGWGRLATQPTTPDDENNSCPTLGPPCPSGRRGQLLPDVTVHSHSLTHTQVSIAHMNYSHKSSSSPPLSDWKRRPQGFPTNHLLLLSPTGLLNLRLKKKL